MVREAAAMDKADYGSWDCGELYYREYLQYHSNEIESDNWNDT